MSATPRRRPTVSVCVRACPGWTYRFYAPPTGATYVLRGVTELTWRAEDDARDGRWDVVRRRTLLSESGMDGVKGGDPLGASKAMCLIW